MHLDSWYRFPGRGGELEGVVEVEVEVEMLESLDLVGRASSRWMEEEK